MVFCCDYETESSYFGIGLYLYFRIAKKSSIIAWALVVTHVIVFFKPEDNFKETTK